MPARWLAAFGEEMVYRGYLLTRAADLGGRTTVLFGLWHYYQGAAGVVDTAFSSLVYGAACLLFGRNLWVPILACGSSNTLVRRGQTPQQV